MNTLTIDINVPEGFKNAGGDQPRRPKAGEYYLNDDLEAVKAERAHKCNRIILAKLWPEYDVLKLPPTPLNDKPGHYVEIKALEDLIKLTEECFIAEGHMTGEQWDQYNAIKELVK